MYNRVYPGYSYISQDNGTQTYIFPFIKQQLYFFFPFHSFLFIGISSCYFQNLAIQELVFYAKIDRTGNFIGSCKTV